MTPVARSDRSYQWLKGEFDAGRIDEGDLPALLSDAWASTYRGMVDVCEFVEVDQGKLTYLFDISAGRVVGVYGRAAPTASPRPSSRMRGHPLPAVEGLVRGHLVAHSIGGGTDINLIPQSAQLNVSGAWRRFERLAQNSPGCFVAIEASYEGESQTPARLTYLVAAKGTLTYDSFDNT